MVEHLWQTVIIWTCLLCIHSFVMFSDSPVLTPILFLTPHFIFSCSQRNRCLHEQLFLRQWHQLCGVPVWGFWWADPRRSNHIKVTVSFFVLLVHVMLIFCCSARLWPEHAQCITRGTERAQRWRGQGSSEYICKSTFSRVLSTWWKYNKLNVSSFTSDTNGHAPSSANHSPSWWLLWRGCSNGSWICTSVLHYKYEQLCNNTCAHSL